MAMRSMMFMLDLVIQTPGALPALIWGLPGVAKTAIMGKLAERLKMVLETVITSIRQPEDFGGIPIPDENDGVRRLTDTWVQRALKIIKEGGTVLAFFDEVSCAAPATQSALLRPVLEGWIGDTYLPRDQVKFAAAANPPDIAAGGWDQSLPLANRWSHLPWPNPTAAEWADFMAGGDGMMPEIFILDLEKWKEEFEKAKPIVGAFFQKGEHEMYLNELDDVLKNDAARFPMAYGSPRSWESATRLYATIRVMQASDDSNARQRADEVKLALMASNVGHPGALAFSTWLTEADLPDPEEVLADPSSWKPKKEREDVMYAVCNGVAAAAVKPQASAKEYKKRWTAAWEVIGKITPFSRGLAAVSARRIAAKKNRPKGSLLDPKVVKVANELKDVLAATGFFDAN